MAKGSSGSRVPARNGGNRRDPSQKVGLGGVVPPNYKPTYGANVGAGDSGGNSVPASNGGNRRDPAQKVGLGGVVPTNYDSYNPPLK